MNLNLLLFATVSHYQSHDIDEFRLSSYDCDRYLILYLLFAQVPRRTSGSFC